MNHYLVIGDVIRDVLVKGSVLGISAETPTMVMKKESSIGTNGGAGLVASHLQKLSERGDWTQQLVDAPVITKKRFFVDGYKLFQVDEFHENSPVELHLANQFIRTATAVIVADNRHGRLDKAAAQAIVGKCAIENVPLFVDSQMSQNESNHEWYIGAETMLLNEKEAGAIGLAGTTELSMKIFSKKFQWKNIIIKKGAAGSVAWLDGKYIKTPGVKVDAIDTCGAGDAFMAALVSTGKLDEESLRFANLYAAGTCTYIGTGVKYD